MIRKNDDMADEALDCLERTVRQTEHRVKNTRRRLDRMIDDLRRASEASGPDTEDGWYPDDRSR